MLKSEKAGILPDNRYEYVAERGDYEEEGDVPSQVPRCIDNWSNVWKKQ